MEKQYKPYHCKNCGHRYDRQVLKGNQKETCPNCKTVNSPAKPKKK